MQKSMQRRLFLKASLGATASLAAEWPWASALGESSTLRAAAETRNVLAGSAVSNSQLHHPAIVSILAEQCRILVAENGMKWRTIHPEPDRYDFTVGDELMAFATNRAMLVRGHNLCWHEAQPAWLPQLATPDNAARLLREHIQTVVGRYAGRIHSWDVVNEGIEPGDLQPGNLRDSFWHKLLGERYIDIAFRAAAQADPKALLTYNDYGLEEDGASNDNKRAATIGLLRWMRQNHIPIHALGLQSHLTAIYDELPSWLGLHGFLKEVAALDLQVFVTELDVNDTDLDGSIEKRAKEAAWLCQDYLKNILKHRHVTAVLTWGPVSHGSYGNHDALAGHRALPFDENLRPTPMLTAMIKAFRKR
jgi:endo-1,4-beta-xylanase